MGYSKRVTVEGKALNCVVCGHGEFHQRAGQLNTQVASFFGLDWLNPQATCYICSRCRFVHWFLK